MTIYLCEYFEDYKWSTSEKKKRKIEEIFLDFIFNKDSFKFKRNRNIIFGDLYEKDFDISHEQKLLFIKYCVHKMFENYLMEDEYKELAIKKHLKRSYLIRDKDLYDTATFDDDIEEYFGRTVFFELCNNKYKINNPKYFQCQECGSFFLKSKNKKVTIQKYCSTCRNVVLKKQWRKNSKKYYHNTKNRKSH